MKTFPDRVECPAGHSFTIRRQHASAGKIVSTYCQGCRKRFLCSVGMPSVVNMGDMPPAQSGAPRATRVPKLRERDIEKRLVARVAELGGECRKVKWIGRNGAPDRVLFLPNRNGYLSIMWAEVKAPGGAAKFPRNAHERAQQREHERMRKLGQVVHVVDSYEGIEEILK